MFACHLRAQTKAGTGGTRTPTHTGERGRNRVCRELAEEEDEKDNGIFRCIIFFDLCLII